MRRVAVRAAAPAALARYKVEAFSGSVAEFKAKIGDGPAVVDFYTDWCGPCKAFAPKFDSLSNSKEFSGVKFLKVNVEESEELGGAFDIRSIPTFVGLKNGKVVGKPVEGASENSVKALLSALVKEA